MSRAIWSVSMSFAPSAANSFATVLLPLAMPPVRAMRGTLPHVSPVLAHARED